MTHNPDTPTNTNIISVDTSGEDLVYTCPHDRASTSHIGLVGHWRIYRTETGEPVPGAPVCTCCIRYRCPRCPRTFMHCIGLFGRMGTHESETDRSPDSPSTPITPGPAHAPQTSKPTATSSTTLSTSRTSTILGLTHTPSPSALTTTSSTIIESDTDATDSSCPHSSRTFTTRIGLIGHWRIHRTETGEPMPGTLTYTRRIRLHCPHCTRIFIRRMGLLGQMRAHENLR
ncbi:hypothetical protein SprV_0200812200 [Sparganum proliferum]